MGQDFRGAPVEMTEANSIGTEQGTQRRKICLVQICRNEKVTSS